MNVVSFFIADTKSTVVEQPMKRGFDDAAKGSQPAAVLRPALGDERNNSTATERVANLLLGVIGPIGQQRQRASASSSVGLFDARDGIDQRHGHLRIVDVGCGVLYGQRRSCRIGNQMSFCAVFPAIRRVRSRFDPPKTARAEQLSINAAHHSIWLDSPKASSRDRHNFFHAPAACQSRRRRQQVIPHPQPISWGRNLSSCSSRRFSGLH